MAGVLSTVARVADSKAPVLIFGESGTGKELIARAIHYASPRKNNKFVTVNCAAIPESLFESELLGHEKCAFTGAQQQRIGKFEEADGGSLFIDEIGDLPLPVQVKLLRAIQFQEIERLGSNTPVKLDIRIISATHRDLPSMVSGHTFREDLYYRMNVVSIQLPPLRKRRVDIPLLVDHFIEYYANMNAKNVAGISREALDALLRYDFPGNIRELENIIQRAVVLARGELIITEDLPGHISAIMEPEAVKSAESQPQVVARDLNKQVEELERRLIEKALEETAGNQVKAAELLGISERTLRYKLSKFR